MMDEADPDKGEPKRAGVALLDLRVGQCRFIVDERVHPVRFCGEPTVRSGSWCAVHRRVVYGHPPSESRPSRTAQGSQAHLAARGSTLL